MSPIFGAAAVVALLATFAPAEQPTQPQAAAVLEIPSGRSAEITCTSSIGCVAMSKDTFESLVKRAAAMGRASCGRST